MNRIGHGWIIILLGMAAIASSWFSIRPAADRRCREMLARHERDPGLVSAEEWVMSKDDEGMTALALIVIGLPAFMVVTFATGFQFRVLKNRRTAAIIVGSGWFVLGAGLHALVWFG
jgi:hypothetical protein